MDFLIGRGRLSTLVGTLLPVLAIFLAPGCGGGGGGGGGGGAVLSIVVTAPGIALDVPAGAFVEILYTDDDLDTDDDTTTTIVAVDVTDANITFDVVLARPHGNGVQQAAFWDTTGVPLGTYKIEATSTDGDVTLMAAAAGQVTITADPPPLLDILEPSGLTDVSRGGFLPVTYVDEQPGVTASTSLYLDRDGDPLTRGDQITIATGRPEMDGQPQSFVASLTGVPFGIYSVVARMDLVGGGLAIAVSPGQLSYDVAGCAVPFGGATTDFGEDIGCFPDGAYMVVGQVDGTGPVNGDGFVNRYGPNCSPEWTRRPSGTGDSYNYDVATFPDGSCAVAGLGSGTVIWGTGEANETTFTDENYLLRFNADGSLEWGIPTVDNGPWIAPIFDGSVAVAGTFTGSITLGAGEPNQTTLSAAGADRDLYVARYNADGTLAWARRDGGTGDEVDRLHVAAFDDGSILVTGEFGGGSATFGLGEANQTTLLSGAAFEPFFARYSGNGTLVWARLGPNAEVSTFPDGAFAMGGGFTGSMTFGAGEPNEETVNATGTGDVWVARYDMNGDFEWVATSSGSGSEAQATSVAAYADGSVVAVGDLSTSKVFGAGEANQTSITGVGFRARFKAGGTLAWARAAESVGDSGQSVAGFIGGGFAVAADFDASTTFGNGTPREVTLNPLGDYDAYSAVYNADGDF